ncbi:MSCRAMM family protein [Streptomyces melanogenes]|uniref:MSCRAMM family protein n=1 Tax=Streptomyces melanogenes TaxID=67326 RepID=UPI00199124BF|nr:SpaA isopeptide-forming pilin-related protein [Streptomyces melanogenes]GGP89487.1 hypothetical protein GCM10010278_79970 [Streptomyces melanogenes]
MTALTLATITAGLTPAFAATHDKSAPGDGTVKVRVIREVNANGTWDQVLEPGMNSVQVKLTDDAGNTITGQTGADGTFTFNPASSGLTGSRYRVEVLNPKPGVLYPAFASRQGLLAANPTSLTSAEEFVDVSGGNNVEMTTGFWNPADYCQKNAPLVTACIRNDIQGGTNNATNTLRTFAYNQRGTDMTTGITPLADKTDTGALYGIGYSKQKKWIFSGAMAFRGSNYGPGKQGGIYLTDRATGATSLFTTVPNAGTTEHNMAIPTQDNTFMPAVGKESLGDVEVSEDGKELYVVNLNDKKLYVYDATQKTAAAPKASYAIPDPGCPSADDWRPYGLGVQDGTVYVGGVCSGQSTQKKSDMRAVVRTFDPKAGAFGSVILDQKLDFPRANTFQSAAPCTGGSWYPWNDTIPKTQDGKSCGFGFYANPMPILSDIIVETDGSLVLGFRDRLADMGGDIANNDTSGVGGGLRPAPGGSLSKACPDANGNFVMAENGGCGFTLPTNPNPASTQYGFYDTRTYWEHGNGFYGGAALSKVEDTIASSAVDPAAQIFTNGTAWARRDGGQTPLGGAPNQKGLAESTSFGKASSMADIEVMCDEAPIQIGNRVWYDNNKNGIQDPTENPVGGVTVNLYDESGKLVATTKTTSRGEYYFDSITDGLKTETKYTIKLDNPADYAAGGPLNGWTATQNDAGGNRYIDSNGIVPSGGQFPEYSFTTGTAGQDNHTYDFGFTKPNGEVRVLKVDAKTGQPIAGAEFQLWMESNNQSGLQTDGATPDTKIDQPVTTDGNGAAKITQQALGSYYWQETKAPAGYDLPNPAVFGPLDLTNANFRDGVTVTVKDEPVTPPPVLGEVQVVKVDQDGKPLPGAEFQLWRETNGTDGLQMTGINADTTVSGTIVTGPDGIAKISGQPMGTYYWQETKAPAGYDLPNPAVFGPLELKPALRARHLHERHRAPMAKVEAGE